MKERRKSLTKEYGNEKVRVWVKYLPKIFVVLSVFCFGIAIGLLYNNESANEKVHPKTRKMTREKAGENISSVLYIEQLVDNLKAENIEDNLKYLTKRVHLAGSPRNNELGETIRKTWASYEFDKVEKLEYKVLLSYPGARNSLQVLGSDGKVKKTYYSQDKLAQRDEDDPERIPPYLAYARSGNVSGEVVYANFGTDEDFEYLRKMGISGQGKIAVIRYGTIFRGAQVANTAKYGYAGVISYSDPILTAPLGKEQVYPKTPWLPYEGLQMGTIITEAGDVLTPSLPAIEGVYRSVHQDNITAPLPSIIMSANNIIEIMKQMKGPEAPKHWRGKLPVTYRLGPGLNGTDRVRYEVNTKLVTRPIYNIIATIYGKDEPDRLVLLGNHRDAWQFGGVDPSSGTAVLLEVARGLSDLRTKGWRPGRTIMLCSWDAEEFGVVGSTEWVEDNQKLLTERAVFYLNLDYAVQGNYTLWAQGSPAMEGLFYDETKRVPDPNSRENMDESMYDIWKQRNPSLGNNKPDFENLHGASDFIAFQQKAGVLSANIRYAFNSHNISYYPVYHTIHDTFAWVKKFADPTFQVHLSMAKLTCRLLIRVADSILLPFNVSYYSDEIRKRFMEFKSKWRAKLKETGVSLEMVDKALVNLTEIAKNFEQETKRFTGKCCRARVMNDQILKLERSFLVNDGKTYTVVFGKVTNNLAYSEWFPGISEALVDYERTKNVDRIKHEVSLLYQAIRSGIRHLEIITFVQQ